MKLTLAKPKHASQISKFYTDLHDQNFPHRELFDSETVASLIHEEELAIIVASHKRSILGCGLAFIRPWNESIEIGAISVAKIKKRSEVAKALFEAVRRLGAKNYGVSYFRASGKKGFERGRNVGATCWGYRPAPGDSSLEAAELIMGLPNPKGNQARVQPPLNAITETPFAARIIRGIENSQRGVPYPKSYPVGCPQGTGAPVVSGRIWPTYHSRGNYISIENAAGAYPVEIIKEFKQKVEKKGVRDIRLTLPVNQEEAYFELLDYGFRTVAYLPGWYLRGAHRFDCVQMVCGLPSIPRSPGTFTEKAVARIDRELNPE